MRNLNLSLLPKTWLIDFDGVLFVHNSHLQSGDQPIENAVKFIKALPKEDRVVILTSRQAKYQKITEKSLKFHGIRYDWIIFDLPVGERILINDTKPKGLKTAHAINTKRDKFSPIKIGFNPKL